jgi:hypothetical protein
MADESKTVQVQFTCRSASGILGCGWQGVVTGVWKPGNYVSCTCPKCGFKLATDQNRRPGRPV